MLDREKVIKGLEFTEAMMTFNPSTGEDIEPENLNEANKTSYDACVGAIALLNEQEADMIALKNAYKELAEKGSVIVRCKDCKHGEKPPTFQCYPKLTWCNKYERSHDDDWFCADGERQEGR